jgi:uncharacterized delta-60 repeat protein
VAVDGSNNLYVADKRNSTIRKITPTGMVTTFAGSPGVPDIADGAGSSARFNQPHGVAVDGDGNVYVADTYNCTIRKITPAGIVTTLAGSPGVWGFANGTNASALFFGPIDVTVDASGNVYVADILNSAIRKITSAGAVTTLAGSPGLAGSADGTGSHARFNLPQGVEVDGSGTVYVADNGNRTIRKITPAGVVTTIAGSPGVEGSDDGIGAAALFDRPKGIAVDGSTNVYVADLDDNTIRKIAPGGVVTTLAGRPGYWALSIDGSGPDAQFYMPSGLAVDGSGNLFIADAGSHTIRKLTSAGVVTTFAGSPVNYGSTDGPRLSARFKLPQSVAVDGNGNVYVADTINSTIRKISPTGVVTTFAGSPGTWGFANGTVGTARFKGPKAVAVDGSNDVYVAEVGSSAIRMITPDGNVTTLAGDPDIPGSVDGNAVDARFDSPSALAADGRGNLYVGDNNTLRSITPSGVVSTLAGSPGVEGSTDGTGSDARFNSLDGLAVDGSGNIFVADSDNNTLRKVTPAGVVTTLAGRPDLIVPNSIDGAGCTAQFNNPKGLAADASGNIYVADYEGGILRKVTPAGGVTTLVGGTGGALRFNNPTGLAIDKNGNLYVSNDQDNNIALVTPRGGPWVTTGLATGLTSSSATLNGTVNPNGFTTTAQFEYGLTPSYGTTVRVTLLPNDGSTELNPSAHLNGLHPGTTYHYRLTATNAQGASSGYDVPFTTEVWEPPAISTQPVSQVRSAGDTATFSAMATGAPLLGYQWWKDGVRLSGATKASLTLTNLQVPDLAGYWVTVTNAFGSVTSTTAWLRFMGTPDSSFNPGVDNSVTSVATQPDGKIVVGGSFSTLGGQKCYWLGRLHTDGTWDASFNTESCGLISSLAVQADGKILAGGGFTTLGGQPRNNIARFNPDGTLDSTFNPGAEGGYANVRSIVVQPDGKILVAGEFTTLSGQPRENIGRLYPDGSPDPSFNPGASSGQWDCWVNTLALQEDGEILVGGLFYTLGGQPRAHIGRLHLDGTLDTAFNPGADFPIYSLAVQADGKILVGGTFAFLCGQRRNYMGRLNPDGTLDSMNPGSWSGVVEAVNSIVVQTDGKILAGGLFTFLNGYWRNNIGRFNADGTLDMKFNPTVHSEVNAIAVQEDGDILLGASFTTLDGQPRNFLGRLVGSEPAWQQLSCVGSNLIWLRGGSSPEVLRTTFDYSLNGSDWIALGSGTRVSGGWQRPGVSIPPGSSIRARGYTVGGLYNSSSGLLEIMGGRPAISLPVYQPVSRTNDAGTTATFKVYAGGDQPLSYQWFKNGQRIADNAMTFGALAPTLILSNVLGGDAGVYFAVISNSLGSVTSAVAVLTVRDPLILSQPTSLALGFGSSAMLNVTAVGAPPLAYQWWKDGVPAVGATSANLMLTEVQMNNLGTYHVVVTNAFGAVTSSAAVLSVNLAALDLDFNPGVGGTYPYVNAIAVQTDDKIVVGGSFTKLAGQTRNGIGRLNADGTLDMSFNPGADYSVLSLAIQGDGKLLVAGNFTTLGGQPRRAIGRLNVDGTLDPGFDPPMSAMNPYVYSVAVQADGKILLGGYFTTLGGLTCTNIFRVNADGTPDISFRPGMGGPAYFSVQALAVQADAKILVAGNFTTLGGQPRNGIGRLNANGTVDMSFHADAGGRELTANSIAVQGDGKILVTGSFTAMGGQPRSGIARLNADGTLDLSFKPAAGGVLALQTDAHILVGGGSTLPDGLARNGISRLHADGTLDPVFTPWAGSANPYAFALAIQSDGRVLVGGGFTLLNGQTRNGIGRLNNTEPATQQLSLDGTTLTWMRGGTSPEVWRTTFDYSLDGSNWTTLGDGLRISNGWQVIDTSLPSDVTIRARGHVIGPGSGSGWFVESRAQVFSQAPFIAGQPVGQIAHAGESVCFSANVTGLPPLFYQWRKDGTNLVNGGGVSGATSSNLCLSLVQPTDAGGYSVVVWNASGSSTSQVAALALDDGSPWARRVARTALPDDELAMGLATDSAGNVYVAGWFDRSNDFGSTTLTSYGGQDAFVAKYGPAGNLQWVRQAGGTGAGWDCARGVGADGAGNAYVTGGFLGAANFSGTSLTSFNNEDCFLAKYDSAGSLQWVRQGSDSWHSAYGTGIAVDSAGNSLVVGYFEGPLVSFGSVTATNVGYAGHAYATFLVKYDSVGTAQWALGLGGGETYSTTVGLDAAGNCYVGGSFKDTLQLGSSQLTAMGDKDGFLAKFNSAGVLQWARQVAGTGWDGGRLGVDAAGNSWFVGNFTGSASIGSTNLTSPTGYGLFVARYDTSGNLQWVRQADGTSFFGTEGGCAVDAAGNCYIPGIYAGAVDFGGTVITNRGGWDIFVAKYDSAGNFQWAQTGGGHGNDGAFHMAVDPSGNCYMAGWFQDVAIIGAETLIAQGYWDVFVARITAPLSPVLRFSAPSGSAGVFQTRLDGIPGASVVVDRSSDLATWLPWHTNTLPSGGLNLMVPMGTNRHQFFRARIP